MSEEKVIFKIVQRDGELVGMFKTDVKVDTVLLLDTLHKAQGKALAILKGSSKSEWDGWSEIGSTQTRHKEGKRSNGIVLDGIGALAFITMLEELSKAVEDKKAADSDKKNNTTDQGPTPQPGNDTQTEEVGPINP